MPTRRKLELTREAFKSCREKPQFKLLEALYDSKTGDELEIEGEDAIVKLDTLLAMLEDEGFEYSVVERDDIIGYYVVEARKVK